jgi:hypothetical protein
MKTPMNSLLCTAMVAATMTLAEDIAVAADPTISDCLSANEASLKLGKEHKLRSERSQLLVCAASTCPADIRKECLSRIDEVNAQIPTLVLSARDASGADLGAVKVTMDGEVLAERLEGTALSVDPGEHAFRFEAAGQSPIAKKLFIMQGQKDRREIVVFGAPHTAPGTALATVSTAHGSEARAESGAGMGTQKVLALVAGGVGIVGLGVGGAFGLAAMSQKNDANSACPNACATQDGVNKWSSAGSSARIADIGFIAGGLGLLGGAVLWFTAPNGSASGSGTQVAFGLGGLQAMGTW